MTQLCLSARVPTRFVSSRFCAQQTDRTTTLCRHSYEREIPRLIRKHHRHRGVSCCSKEEIVSEGKTASIPTAASELDQNPEAGFNLISISDEGKVVKVQNGVVMIQGMTNDAPFGTLLSFQNGQQGLLLWRHSGDCCFGIILQGSESPLQLNDSVVCVKRSCESRQEYVSYEISVDQSLKGQIIDSLQRLNSKGKQIPLLNSQLDMSSRQCIYQPLHMQHKGVDILTPIGRGQCIILASSSSQKLTGLSEHMIKAQETEESLFSVYACIGKSQAETVHIEEHFRQSGLLNSCVFIKCTEMQPVSESFAAICCALSIGEKIRDDGGDALVIIDNIKPLFDIWNEMQDSYSKEEVQDGQELVEVDGTFMAMETAERRRFFSALLQRAAKAAEDLGGGSLTLVPIMNGQPASGQQELKAKIEAIEKDETIPEDLKTKLKAKLGSTIDLPAEQDTRLGQMPTFIVEEMMSIADGQIVLESEGDGVSIDPLLSVSRLGTRVYVPGMERLAPQIRLSLAQAADARQYGSESTTSASESWNARISIYREALIQTSGDLFPFVSQVITLLALEHLQFENSKVEEQLRSVIRSIEDSHPELIQEISQSQQLTKTLEDQIVKILMNASV